MTCYLISTTLSRFDKYPKRSIKPCSIDCLVTSLIVMHSRLAILSISERKDGVTQIVTCSDFLVSLVFVMLFLFNKKTALQLRVSASL